MSDLDDLIAFYKARLGEDEQRATAKRPRSVFAPSLRDPSAPTREEIAAGVDLGAPERNRALRDVEADRKLIAAYEDLTARVSENSRKWWRLKQTAPDDIKQLTTLNRHGERLAGRLEGLTYALRVRAERFDDHPDYPDYDESWRP